MQNNVDDFFQDLSAAIEGEVRRDLTTRILYSTDASIYQLEPLGVVFPRSVDDLGAIVEISARYHMPVLARGAGSSLAGQAIGNALIIDCARHLTKIHEINVEEQTALLEPGVIVTSFNRAVGKYGLQFGPDPATADRATMGGSIANNATGAHSILYGLAADHLLSVDTILADGSAAVFSEIGLAEAEKKAANGHSGKPKSIEAALYGQALEIRSQHADVIQKRWPRVWRRASGYNLNYLIPWSASQPPSWDEENKRLSSHGRGSMPYPPVSDGTINLAPLFAGSESTLGIMRRMKVRLVRKLPSTILGVLSFTGIAEACDAVPHLLEYTPSAIELIPGDMIRLARSVPAYAGLLTFVHGDPAAMLVVEFAGDLKYIQEKMTSLRNGMAGKISADVVVAETAAQQKQVWDVRKVGLGLFASLPGDAKPVGFIEDLAVPVADLGHFVREMEKIMAAHHTRANYYAHASAGCLHIRPLLNLKDVGDVAAMRSIAEQAVELTTQLGGALSGEHGDGFARSEWLEKSFGRDIMSLFKEVKQAADPENILNPGKILDSPPMDAHLRYSDGYHASAWKPVLGFERQDGLAGAIEMCNGAGVCRKTDGVMCPSFQTTQEEMNNTRGRANLLRAWMSGRYPATVKGEIFQATYDALDLCLACKGCKAECPSTVDMAKLKYEFMHYYYSEKPFHRKMRDFLFGYIGWVAPLGSLFAPILNAALAFSPVQKLDEGLLGLTSKRQFPHFSSRPAKVNQIQNDKDIDCLFLSDTFSRYFHPITEQKGVSLLREAGKRVYVLPLLGAGRTLISKGFLKSAKRHAAALIKAIREVDPEGRLPVVGVEPSEILTLRDEFLDFFPGDEYVARLAKRAWMEDEFLIRPDGAGKTVLEQVLEKKSVNDKTKKNAKVLLHGHCYQKAQPPADDGYPSGVAATIAMLNTTGYAVEVVDSGCCGMAGAFGYEREHYDLSMQVGEMVLFPAMRSAASDVILAAAGTSCRSQIHDGTQREAVHPITLV